MRGRRPRSKTVGALNPPPDLDPILFDVWQHLLQTRDALTASAFFERYVTNGPSLLARIHARHAEGLSAGGEAPRATTEELASRSRLGADKPKTEVDLARHREILERKWLVTGYVLVMRREDDGSLRRIPLNYRRVRIGSAAPRMDIVLDLPDGESYQSRLELLEGQFHLHHRDGTQPSIVNWNPVETALLADGDTIVVGNYHMRFFKRLEHPAELHIVNGPHAGERYSIDTSDVWLGREGKRINDIDLPSNTVSREHARIVFHDRRFWLIPETRSSPTAVNGVEIEEPRSLANNDQVVMGELTLLFRVRGPATLAGTLETRVATVLFFDLRGWTAVAESTPLEVLIKQVNEYYTAMGEIIHRYGGTLMTYQGDAIMAVFGAPSVHADDPWRAVAAALRMMREMETLSSRWRSEGKTPLRGGIGIHTGQVMVGELGHSSRIEYSAVGDATNLAARLEDLTKEMQCQIIISDATHREIADVVEARPLGSVTVKGRSTSTEIFEVVALRNLDMPPELERPTPPPERVPDLGETGGWTRDEADDDETALDERTEDAAEAPKCAEEDGADEDADAEPPDEEAAHAEDDAPRAADGGEPGEGGAHAGEERR